MIIHRTLNCKEPFTIFIHLHHFIITHDHGTRFASKCNSEKLLLMNPVCKKKTFLARAFITRAIEIWNDLNVEIKRIVLKDTFKSALCRQIVWFIKLSYIVILYSIVILLARYLNTFN